jgi:hypothetical protein
MGYKIAFSTMALDSKIPQGDASWQSFNDSFENMELDSLEIANLIYLGHPFTTQHEHKRIWIPNSKMQAGGHWSAYRRMENYICGQHIAIDFDTEDMRSSLSHLVQDKFIQKYAHLIYTTPSHTPETPRARVFFTLDTPIMQAKNYALGAAALLWLFGTADRQCKDPCRFFYGSKDCEIEYLSNELPLGVVKMLIQQYQASGSNAKRQHERRNFSAPTDQQEVAEALRKISPWAIDYEQWLSILMGIHHAFGDGGLALAESWADGTPGEVERKWRSFKQDGNGTGKRTIATVFDIAKDFGYQVEKRQPEMAMAA